jgi:hypothetical protein
MSLKVHDRYDIPLLHHSELSNVFGSLLYGLASSLGTSWITEAVSCNAIGAEPINFEFTQSKTPVYRFMLDH